MGSTNVGKTKRFLEQHISAQPLKIFKLSDNSQKEAHGCRILDLEMDNEKIMHLECQNSEKYLKKRHAYTCQSAPPEYLEVGSVSTHCSRTSNCEGSFALREKLDDSKASEKNKSTYKWLTDSPELKRILFMLILQNAWKTQNVQCPLPIPVLIADKELDLYLLRQKVKEMEGEQDISSEIWRQIAVYLGFTSNYGPRLKSIYDVYLRPVKDKHVLEINGGKVAETLVNMIREIIIECSYIKQNEKFASVATLIAESGPFPARRSSERQKVEAIQSLQGDQLLRSFRHGLTHAISLVTNQNNEKRVPSEDCFNRVTQMCSFPEVKLFVNKDHGYDASAPELNNSECSVLNFEGERLQEVIHGTNGVSVNVGNLPTESEGDDLKNALKWMRRVALDPGDPKQGQGTRGSVQNNHWVDACTDIVYKLRSCLWKGRTPRACHLNKEGDMQLGKHYQTSYQGHRSPSNSLMVSCDVRKNQCLLISPATWNEHSLVDLHDKASSGHLHGKVKSLRLSAKVSADFGNYGALRKRIPIGSDFQADIPQCSPEAYATPGIDKGRLPHSSPHRVVRWLGRQVWPLPGGKRVVNQERIGRGGLLTCSCPNPESSACHRLHIKHSNTQLMLEIDDAFSIWGFDEMGERALACWTKEEQDTFQATIKANPASANKFFWDELSAVFPSRSMRDLVSHYFNIYVLRGREIQNRLHLEEVDSDDDEDTLSNIKYMGSITWY